MPLLMIMDASFSILYFGSVHFLNNCVCSFRAIGLVDVNTRSFLNLSVKSQIDWEPNNLENKSSCRKNRIRRL